MDSRRCAAAAILVPLLAGCGPAAMRRFPLRAPILVDDDARPYRATCKPKNEKPCTPPEYISSFLWDGADSLLFHPVTRFLAVDPAPESTNVNALDEVPDSSWFENRVKRRAMSVEELTIGACPRDLETRLDPDAEDGGWVIDKGKANGANPGFRVKLPNGDVYLLKADEGNHPERATAATSIATRIYHAAGYFTGCDTVVYVRRALLRLTPGLANTDNSGAAHRFGEAELDALLAAAGHRGERTRLVASKWLPGTPLGPFTYEGSRKDDPNDVIPHEDRRELRGQRVLAGWLGHFDSREQNSMTTWMPEDPAAPSRGHIRHWIIDLNDCFGSEWKSDAVSKRLNFSYYFDVGAIAHDYVTLGIPRRPWDRVTRSRESAIFGYFESDVFAADEWKPGYQNPAFLRMSERDAAWMARIIARFTPEQIATVVKVGDLSDPKAEAYLTRTLVARQAKILRRYFARVSPITDLAVSDGSLCGVDLARRSGAFAPASFRYRATVRTSDGLVPRPVAPLDDGRICLSLPRLGANGRPDDDPARYLVVEIENGSAERALRVHLYDLGPERGLRLVGIER